MSHFTPPENNRKLLVFREYKIEKITRNELTAQEQIWNILQGVHYVKNVQIRSFFWSVFSCIRTEYAGKYGPEKTPYLDTFQAVAMKKMMVVTAKFSRTPGENWQRNMVIGFNTILAMNISTQSNMRRKIFPHMMIFCMIFIGS